MTLSHEDLVGMYVTINWYHALSHTTPQPYLVKEVQALLANGIEEGWYTDPLAIKIVEAGKALGVDMTLTGSSLLREVQRLELDVITW